MATVAELNTKLDGVQTTLTAIAAEVATLKSVPPSVATQAELDALGQRLDAVHAQATAITV